MNNYKNHRLYNEYISLINDDADFSYMFSDTEVDFKEWVSWAEDNYKSHADEL